MTEQQFRDALHNVFENSDADIDEAGATVVTDAVHKARREERERVARALDQLAKENDRHALKPQAKSSAQYYSTRAAGLLAAANHVREMGDENRG